MRDIKVYGRKIGTLALAIVMTASCMGAVNFKAADSQKGVYSAILENRDTDSHISYLEEYTNAQYPVQSIELSAENCIYESNVSKSEDGALLIKNPAVLNWNVQVEESGLYPLYATYCYTDTKPITDIQTSVLIDGKLPYTEAGELSLRRYWTNGEIKKDANGNDLLPEQIQLSQKITVAFTDPTGNSRYFYFYLEKGAHSISLSLNEGGIKLYNLTFENKCVHDYGEYSKNGNSATGEGLLYADEIQAENMLYKNDSAIVAAKDRSGPDTVPNDPVLMRLNMLDGGAYSEPGQSATWEFSVPEDGKYRIGIRAKQSSVEGLAVYRGLKLDGETLFSEMNEWSFPYTDDWKYTEFGGDNPY